MADGGIDELVESSANEALELLPAVHAFLAGRAPQVQGAVIADLFATWLAEQPWETRQKILARTLATAGTLTLLVGQPEESRTRLRKLAVQIVRAMLEKVIGK